MDAFIDSTIQLLIEWGLPGLFISALLAGSIIPKIIFSITYCFNLNDLHLFYIANIQAIFIIKCYPIVI